MSLHPDPAVALLQLQMQQQISYRENRDKDLEDACTQDFYVHLQNEHWVPHELCVRTLLRANKKPEQEWDGLIIGTNPRTRALTLFALETKQTLTTTKIKKMQKRLTTLASIISRIASSPMPPPNSALYDQWVAFRAYGGIAIHGVLGGGKISNVLMTQIINRGFSSVDLRGFAVQIRA